MDDAETRQPVHVQHPAVHEELAQVAAHVRHGGRVGRAEVDQQNGALHGLRRYWPTRSATLQADTMESPSEMPSR